MAAVSSRLPVFPWDKLEPYKATAAAHADDTVTAHPVYGAAGWLAVVNPGPRTRTATR
ncbi:DUF6194 family protein, partial [Streptomyces zhihengii]